jgi:hypothetical protein
MKYRRQLVKTACVLALVVGVMLVWFRINNKVPEDSVHLVSQVETENAFESVYRTHLPFHVRVEHRLSDRWAPPPNKAGVFVGSVKTHREETVLDVPARYDWIYGDYYLVLHADCSSNLIVTANGQAFDVPIWSGASASSGRFGGAGARINGRRLGGGVYLGSGGARTLVAFDADAGTEEKLIVSATLDKHRQE